ncbi:MAG: four-carbon acid sugar kinase family protein [Bacillota bacterium]|nr:four-carbon acid sugar kinase family protein [Bacillota bacterium]
MVRLFAVADDLTGANATGALLAARGFRAATLRPERLDVLPATPPYDALIVSSNSRALPADEAYARVRMCFSRFKGKGASQFSKRIDTTLRGNVAAEIDAALDELNGVEMAVVVPAFPKSGRITVGGYQIVNGIPLEKTPVAQDPRTPVSKSHVPSLIQEGTNRKVTSIHLGDVLRGWENTLQHLVEARSSGAQVVVVDATTDDEIETIARAASHLPFRVLAVDPGPFTASTAVASSTLGPSHSIPGRRGRVVLAVVGSVTPLTRTQIRRLKDTLPNATIPVDASALAAGELPRSETMVRDAVERVLGAISARASQDMVVIVTSSSTQEDTLDLAGLDRQMSRAMGTSAANLSSGLGRIARTVLESAKQEIAGLYVTGGDITLAVLEEMGAAGIEVSMEILPLAAFGTVVGGPHEGLKLVTKGGLVGGEDAAVQCVCHLLQCSTGWRDSS